MKIMTVLGTRPEIIRLSVIIKKLDIKCQHILVHTGQNYTETLNDIFFKELGLRKPDYSLGIKEPTFGAQIGYILKKTEETLMKESPDRFLVLGDTNSALSAFVAERCGIPVFHMEAGNRCHDPKVPEEVNRRMIDAVSSWSFPYTPGSRENLIREGKEKRKIYVSGNPIGEVLARYKEEIEGSGILTTMGVENGKYFLVTIHRAENVDVKDRLVELMEGLVRVAQQYSQPVICSTHPRTRDKIGKYGLDYTKEIRFIEPLGFFDFVKLEKHAHCVLTDSGTVQEECCLFHVPTVTLRDSTERPETIECGSNILSGIDRDAVADCVELMTQSERNWRIPEGYEVSDVSDRMIKHLLGGEWFV
jgi:UDP-N-acetylglucosamine 2-epimerase (non-hydrolysing)